MQGKWLGGSSNIIWIQSISALQLHCTLKKTARNFTIKFRSFAHQAGVLTLRILYLLTYTVPVGELTAHKFCSCVIEISLLSPVPESAGRIVKR